VDVDADAFIAEVTTSSDADESKPSPDILEAALERAELSANRPTSCATSTALFFAILD
jgi:phosphoglycolate phosphatase-like HAD superfamily hydrolase